MTKAKLDLGLVNQPAAYIGQPVPKELDLHMVRYVTGKRKRAVERDPSLITIEPYDHSDIFYDSRTHLNKLGYDTSVYNDNVDGGSERRKDFYSKIKDACEGYHHVKCHNIGIFPEDRAAMAFNGRYYSVGFENLKSLMHHGTDVIVVEKAGTVLKTVPYTKGRGIAFIQSQGFVSEYGIALAQLANGDLQAAYDFNGGYIPKYTGHLATLMDCDSSGVSIGTKIIGAIRLGLDLECVDEMIEVNKRLGLDLADKLDINSIVETTKPNSHWQGLLGIIQHNNKSNTYRYLREFGIGREIEFYQHYLTQEVFDQNGIPVRFIDWLKTNRIELNTVLAAAKPKAFYNWLNWKLSRLWPMRNYNRVFHKPDPSDVYPVAIKEFIARLDNTIQPLVNEKYTPIEERCKHITGFIKDTVGTRKLIQSSISKKISNEEKIKIVSNRLTALADELDLAHA
ncbi:MAG TPA: hypothetical protein VH796_18400 [Nitrososphaeraceae archaeon]|jgi:hypothetical protein